MDSNPRLTTTKADKKQHGLGTSIIREIARKYNTDYNLLAMLNGISINDYIYPDTTILVPKKDVKYYFTKDNDTLSSVNKLLGSNINNLLRQNKNIYLREGQLIVYKD